MRDISRGLIAIIAFIVVAVFMPIVELGRIIDPSSPEIVTGGWSNPTLIFLFGAYSGLSSFQPRYWIGDDISQASTLPFLLPMSLYILLLILLMIGKTSPKAAFPASLLILIPWVWLSFQTYAVLDDLIVIPVLVIPLVGSFLTLLFVHDIEPLRRLLGLNE